MEIKSVDKEEYEKIIKKSKYIYNAPWFHDINGSKVDQLFYFLFKGSKYKCGIIIGKREEKALIPYSAPFAMFEKICDLKLEELDEIVQLLEEYLFQKGIKKIYFRMPPSFYDETFISEIQNILVRRKYNIETFDLNYQFNIHNEEYYLSSLQRNAKKNLNKAKQVNWNFIHCEDLESKKNAYDVIKINRESKGYPLRMSWEAVKETIANIDHDFFLLEKEGQFVASAVIFRVTEEVYQVIYWGDIPQYGLERPMNYLAYMVYNFYVKKNIRVLDIGPSTEDSIPNYGLCSFKKSIGCDISSKITFIKELCNDGKE